jgi:hypothetical protein
MHGFISTKDDKSDRISVVDSSWTHAIHGLVYLATPQPLEWHLRFSLNRLAFHHSLVYVIILYVGLCLLLQIIFLRRTLAWSRVDISA